MAKGQSFHIRSDTSEKIDRLRQALQAQTPIPITKASTIDYGISLSLWYVGYLADTGAPLPSIESLEVIQENEHGNSQRRST